jgi:hypothetical protein
MTNLDTLPMKSLLISMLALPVLGLQPAFAHHSLAAYDTQRYRTVEGVAKEFVWANPHTILTLIVEEIPGYPKEWRFEGGSTGRLHMGGFVSDTIVPGEKITVSYNARLDGSDGGFFLAVTKADGALYALPRFHNLSAEE